mgnify:CR=1 FL=1
MNMITLPKVYIFFESINVSILNTLSRILTLSPITPV